jgi:hypothetical protein
MMLGAEVMVTPVTVGSSSPPPDPQAKSVKARAKTARTRISAPGLGRE